MTQTLAFSEETLIDQGIHQILCFYVNNTSKLQVIRINTSSDLHVERVIFPGQRLMFEAIPEAKLEIIQPEGSSRSIVCAQLAVKEILNNTPI